jgi:hypothetical protein
MFEHISAAVHPRTLAVPNAVHPVELRTGKHLENLAAHHRCGPELFIDGGLVHDVMFFEKMPHTGQGQIIPGQWRAFVPGDESARAHLIAGIATMLIDRQPHQRLNTRQIDLSFGQDIFVIQSHGHGGLLRAASVVDPNALGDT